MSNDILRHKTVIMFILLLLAVSCREKQLTYTASLNMKTIEGGSGSGNQWLKVTASDEWTLKISEDGLGEGEEISWAWIKKSLASEAATTVSSTGSANILMEWTANPTGGIRSCYFELTANDITTRYVFTQLASTGGGTSTDRFQSDPIPDWLELPAIKTDATHYYVNHRMKVGTKDTRNYSFFLDTKACISLWVAYPLNKGLIGTNTGRTDAWGLDPKVPSDYQPVIYSAFRGYQRGHQLPSADRYGGNNASTFYGTNMTPQLGGLNENAWALLEEKVRTWSYSFDTLYIVTGADISGSYTTVRDNWSKDITVPSGYFKALLGYKKSGTIADTGKNGGYTGIAFYFDHRSYSKDISTVMAQSMTIDELEKKLGYDFFPNLSSKTSSANAVEANVNSWWK